MTTHSRSAHLLERLKARFELVLVLDLLLREIGPGRHHDGQRGVRRRVELTTQGREPHLQRRGQRLVRGEW